jgi:hypothetical protein
MFIIIIIIIIFATSFGLKRPSSSQYLLKLKMMMHVVKKSQFCGIPFTFISGNFCSYWPYGDP